MNIFSGLDQRWAVAIVSARGAIGVVFTNLANSEKLVGAQVIS